MNTAITLQVIATFIAAVAATLSYLSVRSSRAHSRANILLACLNAYLQVRRRRNTAQESKRESECREYYREIFDLHWSEFQLFLGKHLDSSVMRAWLDSRQRNFAADRIEWQAEDGQQRVVRYSDVWHELTNSGYFSPTDVFVKFMNLAHDGKITEALSCRS